MGLADYQNYLFNNASEITGTITVGQGNGIVDPSRFIYGATWWADDEGSFSTQPKNGILSIYYEPLDKKLKLDLSALFKSLQSQYPQVNKLTKTDKPLTVEINGQKIVLEKYSYLKSDQVQGNDKTDTPTGEYYFISDALSEVPFGLDKLVGQTVDIKISW